MTTVTKPQFKVKWLPFSSKFLPLNDEALKLCALADRPFLWTEEVKSLLIAGIEIDYKEEKEYGLPSKSS